MPKGVPKRQEQLMEAMDGLIRTDRNLLVRRLERWAQRNGVESIPVSEIRPIIEGEYLPSVSDQ